MAALRLPWRVPDIRDDLGRDNRNPLVAWINRTTDARRPFATFRPIRRTNTAVIMYSYSCALYMNCGITTSIPVNYCNPPRTRCFDRRTMLVRYIDDIALGRCDSTRVIEDVSPTHVQAKAARYMQSRRIEDGHGRVESAT